MRRLSILVVTLGLLGLIGCTDDEASAAELCRVLGDLPPDSRWNDVDLMIYVDPAAEEQDVEALLSAVERDDAVAGHGWISQQEAYDEFVELYADVPEMIEAVRPEILPPVIPVTLVEGVEDPTALRFDDQPGVYRVVHGRRDQMIVIDWSIRPLTSPLGSTLSAFTLGRTDIDLAGAAPPHLRDDAEAIEALWAAPMTASDEVRERAMAGARQVAAFYDTECG